MDETMKNEREKRRIQRKRKRQTRSIVTFMILFIMATVGVVSGQTQGYQVFYRGESLGYVQSAAVFKSAVDRIETNLMTCYNYDNIHLGNGFELIQGRVENPMDFETCIEVLNSKNIPLYVSGADVFMDDEKIGTVTSLDQAEALIDAYQNINSENLSELEAVEVMVPLSETKDFAAMLSALKARPK